MDIIMNFALNFVTTHPKLAAFIGFLLVVNTIVKSIVDALVSSRAQWDATPETADNWYEKALVLAVRVMQVTAKAAAYLAGFRPKPKSEIVQNIK